MKKRNKKMKNTIRKLTVPVALMTLCALTIKDYLEDSTIRRFGIIKEGPYRMAKYHITEKENRREIKIYQRNDNPVYEETSIMAVDERKDGIYEEIRVVLKGKDTSRSLGNIQSDLTSILKEMNSK